MTLKEMSDEFDILYNQVNSNQAPGIDNYEKSVFLTHSQEQIIKGYFNPKGNKFLEGFDQSQLRQYDFQFLITNTVLQRWDDYFPGQGSVYDPRSIRFASPCNTCNQDKALIILNESIVEKKNDVVTKIYQIVPISYDRYASVMQKTYKFPPKNIVWKLITGQNIDASCYEIIGRFNSGVDIEYRMRYVKEPLPIILVNLKEEFGADVTINGYYGDPVTENTIANQSGGIDCRLPKGVHRDVVVRAVELATSIYNPQALSSIIGAGNYSSTDLGIIQKQENRQ